MGTRKETGRDRDWEREEERGKWTEGDRKTGKGGKELVEREKETERERERERERGRRRERERK
jgi:hypothetical protein